LILNLLSNIQTGSSWNVGYINRVLHKAAIANKLKYVETRSSAYNTSTVTISIRYSGLFADKIQINLKMQNDAWNFRGRKLPGFPPWLQAWQQTHLSISITFS